MVNVKLLYYQLKYHAFRYLLYNLYLFFTFSILKLFILKYIRCRNGKYSAKFHIHQACLFPLQ